MKRSLLAFVSMISLAAVVPAQTIEVPEDYPDLQQAIDAAPPGATIVVHGGYWYALSLTKPVRIVGDPRPSIIAGYGSKALVPPITLVGPGSGKVVLSNVNIGGNASTFGFSLLYLAPGIRGGGFDGLFVYDSTVRAPAWASVYNYVFAGATAIETTVPLVRIERSTVVGSDTRADQTTEHFPGSGNPTPLGAPAGSGIVTSGNVILIDSTVRAGSGDYVNYASFDCNFSCPGGDGGDGVVARTLIRRNSTVTPGAPSSYYTAYGLGTYCCSGSYGSRVVVRREIVIPPRRGPRNPMSVIFGPAGWPLRPGVR